MTLKQKKYYDAKLLYNLLDSEKNSIALITHISNFNILQSNLLQVFSKQNDIKSAYIKLNLVKKITKNSLFLNLFVGPTKIFFFKNLSSFMNFLHFINIEKKIIPLALYFNNQIFSYSFFISQIKIYFTSSNLTKHELYSNLIVNLNKKSVNFIQTLSFTMNNFINFLTYLKIQKKN